MTDKDPRADHSHGGRQPTNPRHSTVSGGGERDRHHAHDPADKGGR